MLSLTVLFACLQAAPPERLPDAAPPQAEPSTATPPPLTVQSVRRECGPDDAPIIRVRALAPSGADIAVDLPDSIAPGVLSEVVVSHPGEPTFLVGSGEVDAYEDGHLKAAVTIPGLEGHASVEVSIDAQVEDITGGCG